MHQCEGALHALVLQVGVGAEELRRHQHPLVDDRARAEAREDEVGAGGELGDAADHVQLALERVRVEAWGGGDDAVSDTRRSRRRGVTDVGEIERHVAPGDDALSLCLDGRADELLELGAARLVGRQEADGDAVLTWLREAGYDRPEELVGQLDQDAGAVTGLRVGAGSAAVLEVLERADRPHDRLVRGDAVQFGDRADPAGVVLPGRVVEADPPGRAALLGLRGNAGRCGAGRHWNLSCSKGPAVSSELAGGAGKGLPTSARASWPRRSRCSS
jgi:hypothetical protein